MKLTCTGFCETGSVRTVNQDAFGIYQQGSRGLFFVADGMGGHSNGDWASTVVRDALDDWWIRNAENVFDGSVQAAEALKVVLRFANDKIWGKMGEKVLCGSTIVLLWVESNKYALLWAGDSRCYHLSKSWRGIKRRILTVDDTWENQPELTRGLTADAIMNHPNYGRLTLAVGTETDFSCHLATGELSGKELFLLCSDGIYKYIDSKALWAGMKRSMKPGRMAEGLEAIRTNVYAGGAPDNLTCIVVSTDV